MQTKTYIGGTKFNE